jgi:outer membrane protein
MAANSIHAVALLGAGLMLAAAAPDPGAPSARAAAAVTLLSLYQAAQSDNPGIKAAEAGVGAAQYGLHDAYFGYLPRASLIYNPQREYQDVISTQNPVYQAGQRTFTNQGYSFQVLQPVIDLPAVARIASAYAERRNQRSQLVATQQKMTYDLIEGYLLALASLDDERLAATEETTYAKHRDELRRRLDRGMGNRTDLADIEARIAKAQADRINAHAGVQKALTVLQRVSVQPVTAILPLQNDVPLGMPVPADPEQWVASARDTNPELKALAAQEDVAELEVKRLFAQLLPRLDVILSSERLNAGGSLYGGGADTLQQIAELRLTVPLFNADGLGYPAFAAQQKSRQTHYTAEDRQLDTDQRVRASYLDAAHDSEAASPLREAVRDRSLVRDDVQRKFSAGVVPIGEVIDSERDYVRSERELLAAKYNYLIAMMQLKRLTGTIGQDDVRYIDTLLDRSHAYVAMAAAERKP